MRPSLRQWFVTGVLASALVVGCNNTQKQTVQSSSRPMMMASTRPVYGNGNTYAMTQQPAPQAPAQPVIVPTERTAVALPPAVPARSESEMVPAIYSPTTPEVKEQPVPRRSFADTTANPCFNHAADYSSLTGELHHVHVRNTWTLRYASVDEEDRFGGSVTLAEMGSMDRFKDGQMVHVVGQMVDLESHEPSPAYRVRSMDPVTNP